MIGSMYMQPGGMYTFVEHVSRADVPSLNCRMRGSS